MTNEDENENENEDENAWRDSRFWFWFSFWLRKMDKARNFRNYKVWQDAVEYSTKIYQQTDKMPWFEKKGLCDQLQRAAVSIGSNIAEGSAKPSNVEFAHYLDTALGSAYEVETQLLIANKIGYIDNEKYKELHNGIINIEKQLAGLIRSLRQ